MIFKNIDILLISLIYIFLLWKVNLVSFRWPLSKKSIAYFSIVLLYFASTWYSTEIVENNVRSKQTEKLLGYAPSYAIVLEKMGHENISEKTSPDNSRYQELIDYQKEWLKANPFVTDVYTMKRNSKGQVVLIVDSETDYDQDGLFSGEREGRTSIGEVFTKELPEIDSAFEGKPAFTENSYTDRWGTWVSAFVPMKNKQGKVDAILGLDFSYESFNGEIQWSRIVVVGCSIFFSLSIFSLLYIREQQTENNIRLNLARLKAEKAAEVKSSFLANMSHEIRTPLNGILGMISLISEQNLEQDLRKQIAIMKNCGENLSTLFNDILDFSKIEAGKLQLEATSFHVEKTLEEIVELLRTNAESKGLSIICERMDPSPHWILLDQNRFRQIMMNLIGNAIKFTADGSVTIKSKVQPLDSNKVFVEVRIVDTGIGMDEEAQRKLFQSFSQVDASTTRRFGGTGLGLAICKGLIDAMGGEIRVVSSPGLGSEFIVTFTVPMAMPEEGSNAKSKTVNLNLAKEKPLNILVADDHSTNRLLASKFLEKLGYKVDCVTNGLEVLDAVSEKRYDVIFMDCQMPEMDGFSASRKITERFSKKSRPWIIALTASAFDSDRKRCADAGMNYFVSKPFDILSLATAIEKVDRGSQESMPLLFKNKDPLPEKIHFNYERLRKQFEPDLDIMYDFIEDYLRNTESLLSELESAFSAKNLSKVNLVAHKLRGNVSYFSIASLQKNFLVLENLKTEAELQNSLGFLENIKTDLNQLHQQLEQIMLQKAG